MLSAIFTRYIEGKWLIRLIQLYQREELCHPYGTILDSVPTTKEKLSMREWPFVADVAVMFVRVVGIRRICFRI